MFPHINSTLKQMGLRTNCILWSQICSQGTCTYGWQTPIFLTMAAVQPLYRQASDIFGKRVPLIISIAMFILGSGLCGGANNTAMLIHIKAFGGVGGGGLFVMVDIIVADLVPLRESQKYMSMVMGTSALGTFVGPIIGGAIASKTS